MYSSKECLFHFLYRPLSTTAQSDGRKSSDVKSYRWVGVTETSSHKHK